GAVTEQQLQVALERHRQTRRRLGQILIDLKLVDEPTLVECLAEQFRKPSITAADLAALDLEVVKVLPAEVARQHTIIAVERTARKLVIALADPLNFVALAAVRRGTRPQGAFNTRPPPAIPAPIDA